MPGCEGALKVFIEANPPNHATREEGVQRNLLKLVNRRQVNNKRAVWEDASIGGPAQPRGEKGGNP